MLFSCLLFLVYYVYLLLNKICSLETGVIIFGMQYFKPWFYLKTTPKDVISI